MVNQVLAKLLGDRGRVDYRFVPMANQVLAKPFRAYARPLDGFVPMANQVLAKLRTRTGGHHGVLYLWQIRYLQNDNRVYLQDTWFCTYGKSGTCKTMRGRHISAIQFCTYGKSGTCKTVKRKIPDEPSIFLKFFKKKCVRFPVSSNFFLVFSRKICCSSPQA